MKPVPSLPRHRGGAWPGGIVFDSPVYTASISASGRQGDAFLGPALQAHERKSVVAPRQGYPGDVPFRIEQKQEAFDILDAIGEQDERLNGWWLDARAD